MNAEIIPVIHIVTKEQAIFNIELCIKNNIKKVFLISHGYMTNDELFGFAIACKAKYSTLWIGVNFLGLATEEILKMESKIIDSIWCDQTIDIYMHSKKVFPGEVFSGVAFKYQPQAQDLKRACEDACFLTDVITTSGPGTGKEISLIKLANIRSYIGDHKLAVASGINKDNIKAIAEFANYLMIASSITDSETELIIESKLIELIEAIKE